MKMIDKKSDQYFSLSPYVNGDSEHGKIYITLTDVGKLFMRPFHCCRCSPSAKKAEQSGFSRFLSTSSKGKSTARAAQSLIQPVRVNVNQSKAGRGGEQRFMAI